MITEKQYRDTKKQLESDLSMTNDEANVIMIESKLEYVIRELIKRDENELREYMVKAA